MQHRTWDLALHRSASWILCFLSHFMHNSQRRGCWGSPLLTHQKWHQQCHTCQGPVEVSDQWGDIGVFGTGEAAVKWWLVSGMDGLSSGDWKFIGPSPLPCFSVIFSFYQWLKELKKFFTSLTSGTRIQYGQLHKGSFGQLGLASGSSHKGHSWQFLVASPEKLCGGWNGLISNISYW